MLLIKFSLFAEILIWFCIFPILYSQTDLSTYLDNIEQNLISFAAKVENEYSNRCSKNCQPSYDACSSILPNLHCATEFKLSACSCYSPGRPVNKTVTTVKLADISTKPTNASNQDVKEMICSTSSLDQEFVNLRQNIPSIKWHYIGTYNGVMRLYPGRDRCTQYDPRPRPWYVAAASGAKNLIMILDISNSMNDDGKIYMMKQTATTIIDTLSITDWVGITAFNSEASNYNDFLVRATSDNKAFIKNYINNLTPISETNFEAAFNKAFSMITNSYQAEYGNLCKTIIMFMTDGYPTVGEQNSTKILSLVKSLDLYNSTIFTYALGSEASPEIPSLLACNFHGIFDSVESSSDLLDAMQNYYIYVANGLNRTSAIWTEPYIDASGLGNVTTSGYPIYDRSTTPPYLIGVVGIDILMSDIQKFGDNSQIILNELVARSQKCSSDLLSECQLESLRGQYACGSTNATCNKIGKTANLCSSFNKFPFMEGSKHTTQVDINLCCGNYTCNGGDNNNIGIIVGPVLGSVVVIIIIFIIIYVFYRRPSKKKQIEKKKSIEGMEIEPIQSEPNFQNNENPNNNNVQI